MRKLFERDFVAFDIGGANLKAYHSSGSSSSVVFPMWRRPKSLSVELVSLASCFSEAQTWCITMTGEMADVFANRREGVHTIVQQSMNAAEAMGIHDVRFYSTGGYFVNAVAAMADWDSIASANWHALATWVSNWVDRPSLLVDVGSTTADLIPISPLQIHSRSRTDHDRLKNHELVYLGIERTPVCAIVQWFPMGANRVPVMREVFANADDCAIVLGWVREDEADTNSCDDRPRTCRWATNRLARMVGLDETQVTLDQAQAWARHVMTTATERISEAATMHLLHSETQWIISGHAKKLVCPPDSASVIDLSTKLGPEIARVAPAYAMGMLFEVVRDASEAAEATEPS